jgi:hypothetical protein
LRESGLFEQKGTADALFALVSFLSYASLFVHMLFGFVAIAFGKREYEWTNAEILAQR